MNFIHRLGFDKKSSSEVGFVICEVNDVRVHSVSSFSWQKVEAILK